MAPTQPLGLYRRSCKLGRQAHCRRPLNQSVESSGGDRYAPSTHGSARTASRRRRRSRCRRCRAPAPPRTARGRPAARRQRGARWRTPRRASPHPTDRLTPRWPGHHQAPFPAHAPVAEGVTMRRRARATPRVHTHSTRRHIHCQLIQNHPVTQ